MIHHVFVSWSVWAWVIAGGCVAGTVLEVLIPGEKQSWMSRLRAIPCWLLFILVGVTIGEMARWGWMLLGVKPLVVADLRDAVTSSQWWLVVLGYTVLPALTFFISDGFYYWFHRLQHRQRMLWRVHSVHHSIEELNAVNDYHHVLEEILRFPLIFVPLSLLIQLQTPTVIVYSTLLALVGAAHACKFQGLVWLAALRVRGATLSPHPSFSGDTALGQEFRVPVSGLGHHFRHRLFSGPQ